MVGYIFLGQVIVMGSLVTWLFIEALRYDVQVKRAREQGDPVPSRCYFVGKELCTYGTITAFFALSYIGRYLNNEFFRACGSNVDPFVANMAELACYFFEGASMGALMCVHMESVKPKSERRKIATSIQAEEPFPYRMDSDEEIASQ